VQRFIVTVEGPSWTTVEEIELPGLPQVGEPIDTQYGTLLVAETSAAPGDSPHSGAIVCRMP
jgi:hypothetical protein